MAIGFYSHTPVLAQQSGLGLKGGLVLSDTKSATVTTNKIPGGCLGGYFALRAGPRMEIQPELLFTSMGAGYTMADGDQSTVRTLYAQVPVSVKLYIGNVFNGQAGFQMGRLLTAQQTADDGRTDVTDSYNRWDYGITLGLGADLVSGLDLGLRYYSGLRPILLNDVLLYPHNRALMLTAGQRLTRVKAPRFTRRRN